MKKSINPVLFSLLLLCIMAVAQISHAQAPPPPPAEKGTNSNKGPGNGAPIDEGIYVALAMVAGFGAWKMHKVMQQKKVEAGR